MSSLRSGHAIAIFAFIVAAPAALALATPSLPPDILPFAQVRAGMTGTGRTVFQGEKLDSFNVEILGKLDHIGPGQDLILAKLTSPVLERTGELEGMSGSPVYIDGKMIGAVAYSWEFSREAIAGITPIEEMLLIPEPAPRASPWSSAGVSSTRQRLDSLHEPLMASAHFDQLLGDLAGAPRVPAPMVRLGLPISVTGLSRGWLDQRMAGRGSLSYLHFGGASGTIPAASATAGSSQPGSPEIERPSAPLAPGDAVGASLVQGDIDFTAYGTVTRVDGDRVLAFGHPFLQLGPVEMPMTRARVETLMPALSSSFKLASSTAIAGAFFQDRAVGISGKLGARARTVPVRLVVQSSTGVSRSYAYEVVADPLLTPVLLYLTLGGILEATEKVAGESSVEIKEGSVLRFDGDRKADLSNLFAGESAVPTASAMVGVIAEVLLQNEFEAVRLEAVNLIISYSGDHRGARITGAWPDRNQVRPGEQVSVSVAVKPYRETERIETIAIEIPKETPPGKLTLHVGDARSLTRVEQAGAEGFAPLDFGHLLELVNALRKNRTLAILGTREEPSVLIGSEPFPNLPPSKSSLLLRRDGRGTFSILRTRPILDETLETEYSIEGYRKIDIEVVH